MSSEETKLAEDIARVYMERQDLLDQLHAAERELGAARERERIAVEAYNQQQSSYRELEALYQQMTERAIQAEADYAMLRAAEHLPGRPDLAKAVLSAIMEER